MPCLHAISSLLEKDRKQRIGAISFHSFSDNPFFRPLDFEALERKEIDPIFIPSSDKTNFDATYDLEELLLEEAPLEARARRQKPREALKTDATDQEIRIEELHRMIETLFEPFNYETLAPERAPVTAEDTTPLSSASAASGSDAGPRPISGPQTPGADGLRCPDPNRSATHSPNGSPPLATSNMSIRPSDRTPTDRVPQSSPPAHSQHSQDYFDTNNPDATPPSFSRPIHPRTRGSTRSTSMGGGVQVVLNESGTGSWSDMANQSPKKADQGGEEKPTGMLGFLSRKKGRDRSPKAKERGVLGKEGARVIISNT